MGQGPESLLVVEQKDVELKLKDWVILKTGDLLTFEVLVQTWKKAPEMEAAQMSLKGLSLMD